MAPPVHKDPADPNMTDSVSIGICSYEPDPRAISRLIEAVLQLDGIERIDEVIVVDNSSPTPVSSHQCVQKLLRFHPNARCVTEDQKGSAYARCRAISETTSDVLVFFDDDNEPAPGYLSALYHAFKQFPNVGAWGPAKINVEFLDHTADCIRRRADLFLERDDPFGYVCSPGEWNKYCPPGAGCAFRRQILNRYLTGVQSGRLRMTGRTERNCSSAEDVQMIWEAFRMGLAVGILPELEINHLIPSRKANPDFIRKLVFGTSCSFLPAKSESFPEAYTSQELSLRNAAWKYLLSLIKTGCRPGARLEHMVYRANLVGQTYGLALSQNHRLTGTIHRFACTVGYV
jgi:GT2 family glycosyltransferase